jgi:hypothetical protein
MRARALPRTSWLYKVRPRYQILQNLLARVVGMLRPHSGDMDSGHGPQINAPSDLHVHLGSARGGLPTLLKQRIGSPVVVTSSQFC